MLRLLFVVFLAIPAISPLGQALAVETAKTAAQPTPADDPSTQETKPTQVGAWSYRKVADEGLMRSAETVERIRKDSRLGTMEPDNQTCPPAKDGDKVAFAFASERHETSFQPKGPAGSQRVKARLFFGLHGAYEATGKPVVLELGEEDGALHFSAGLKAVQAHGLLALCPTDVKGKPTKDCHEYSLDGFSQAYAFVCGRK